MTKRLTTLYPHLFGPYSHRVAKDGPTLNGLSLKYEGEELVSAAIARGQMKIMGKIEAEAERFLDENPEGLFAVVDTPFDCRVPFMYRKEPTDAKVKPLAP